ncbi:3528_t:CDS:1, partial [Cetraspora pellucida]
DQGWSSQQILYRDMSLISKTTTETTNANNTSMTDITNIVEYFNRAQ